MNENLGWFREIEGDVVIRRSWDLRIFEISGRVIWIWFVRGFGNVR